MQRYHSCMDIRSALNGSGLPMPYTEILLAAVLGKDRAWIIAHDEESLTDAHWSKLQTWIDRRKMFEPIAYITGTQEFFGRSFNVDHRVLIPRSSTEHLVQLALDVLASGIEETRELDEKIIGVAKIFRDLFAVRTIVDVGTGSGCIAITLALEHPEMRIIATDISNDALEVARGNAKRHGVIDRITFLQGDGLKPLKTFDQPFLIVSNPPYIPKGRTLMKDVVDFEPHVALFGGEAGTSVLGSLIQSAEMHPQCLGYLVECEAEQH